MSKCPFCGTELESEVYRNMPHSYMGYKFRSYEYTLYCPNGDFGTDYTCPSKALKELVSAYKSVGNEAENDKMDFDDWEDIKKFVENGGK